tara:strand:+ start:140 stop:541 length:402 start_codon:yes stop_codon:yes gene_type:complete
MSIGSFKHEAGLNHVGAYQVSGTPFASGSIDASSAVKITFPYVTRWVQIVNNDTSNAVKVGFSSIGVQGTNYFTIGKGATSVPTSSERLEVKVTELWLYGADDVDVVAGLTSINGRMTTTDSGTSWSGSSGVG